MLSAEHICFSYGKKKILDDISFIVNSGECLVIRGENGSGKSTLLLVLSGNLKLDSGEVKADGRIGLVPQGNSIFEDMTVGENLRFFAHLAGKKVTRMPFDLEQYEKTKAAKLSGGFKKRLNVACTLVSAPDIWLFDEPCANLDEKWRSELAAMIRSLKKRGCTIVYVSHDTAEYESFADKVLLMK